MSNIQQSCPTCDSQVEIPEGTLESELLTCDDCDTMLEVISNNGNLQLQEAPEIEEDWGE